jgi:high-affinity iron transporter
MQISSLIRTFPPWQAYAQSDSGPIPSINMFEKNNQQSITPEGNKSNSIDNIKIQEATLSNSILEIRTGLNQFLSLYKNQQVNPSMDKLKSIYDNTHQKIIVPLSSINSEFSLSLETKFNELIEMVHEQRSYNEVTSIVKEIEFQLDTYVLITPTSNVSFTPTIAFASSFSIIFREGLEAAIILGAILTYLEVSRNQGFKKYVYIGIIIAVVTTLGFWFLLNYAFQYSNINKDLLKGIAGIAAVAVLFWVSFWALNKLESRKWVEFIKSRVGKAAIGGSVTIFILISFFTVLREGIETVIFYQSLFNFTHNIDSYILSGLVLGILVVIVISVLIKKIMKKLPLRAIFGITMGIGAFMSVVFIGNAIKSFQAAGFIQTTPLTFTIPSLDPSIASMTGIYPTLEGLLTQVFLICIYLIGMTFMVVFKVKEKKINGTKVKSKR